ncbi:MAG: NUDIX hydrolase [Victivallales bacterium]|jgi:8-oxo-dGTP pyrophosphatase MutT (NUDIX family)|nr:NUDIX hydrolase [Victivallales bacterium]
MKPKIIGENVIAQGNFLILGELEYDDGHGTLRCWETCNRFNACGAVFIFARIVPDDELLFVRQFRPPAGRLMLEFPAGLIDPGETPEETALRELYEETGYRGVVVGSCRPGWSSPGMTGETIQMVKVEIDGNAYRNQAVEAHPEECEHIEVFRVKRLKLAEFVADQEAQGVGIDSKIYTYCTALTDVNCQLPFSRQ